LNLIALGEELGVKLIRRLTRGDDNPWPGCPATIGTSRQDTEAQIQALVDGQAAAGPPAGSWPVTAEVIAVRGNGRSS
jgi:hypothetical protein